jgi:hypothetical protein
MIVHRTDTDRQRVYNPSPAEVADILTLKRSITTWRQPNEAWADWHYNQPTGRFTITHTSPDGETIAIQLTAEETKQLRHYLTNNPDTDHA